MRKIANEKIKIGLIKNLSEFEGFGKGATVGRGSKGQCVNYGKFAAESVGQYSINLLKWKMLIKVFCSPNDCGEVLKVAADDINASSFLLGDIPNQVGKEWFSLFLPVVEATINRCKTLHCQNSSSIDTGQ